LAPSSGGGTADALPVDDHAACVGEIHDEFIVVRFATMSVSPPRDDVIKNDLAQDQGEEQDDEGSGVASLRGGALVVWVGSAIWPSL
jgi:hypothetical protein